MKKRGIPFLIENLLRDLSFLQDLDWYFWTETILELRSVSVKIKIWRSLEKFYGIFIENYMMHKILARKRSRKFKVLRKQNLQEYDEICSQKQNVEFLKKES